MIETPEPAAIGAAPSVDFVEEDLVVALEHRRLVEAELARLQLRYGNSDEDKDLDLVLLKGLKGLAGRAMQIRAYHRAEIAALETAAQRPFTDLDVVLFAVRGQFAERYGGWVPDMGKNRRIASVTPAGPGETLRMGGQSSGAASPAPALPFSGFVTLGPGRTMPMFGTLGPGRTMAMTGRDPRWVDPEILRSAGGSAGTGVHVGMVDTALYDPRPAPGELGDVVRPFAGHATFVTSLIKQQAPAATLTLEPLFDPETGKATAWDTAKAMVGFAGAGNPVDILNLSLGCRTADGQPPLVLTRAMERLAGKMLIVAAAGNHADSDHPSAPMWPAALRNVVAVGAYRSEDGSLADFSPMLPWVTVAAPGVDVVGAFPHALIELSDGSRVMFDGAAMWSGTSFAAATVSGMVAAATRKGQPAREAFDELLVPPDGVVKKFEYPP